MQTIEGILFDLDGTLLPMDNDRFVELYMRELARAGAGWGFDPRELVNAVWKSTGSMIRNDGSRPGKAVFWESFKQHITGRTPAEIDARVADFDAFYTDPDGFHRTRAATRANPLAREAVLAARRRAGKVILATNPIFPRVAIESRLGWLELDPGLFDEITVYENIGFTKPNPAYYAEILRRAGLTPERCVMIGNDVHEDIEPAAAAGMQTVLVTDCLLNRDGRPLDGIRTCAFADLPALIEHL